MKKSELRNIIREEVEKVCISEGIFSNMSRIVGYEYDDFKKNYLKLSRKNKIIRYGGYYYGMKTGTKEADWKYDIHSSELLYDIDKSKALGLIHAFDRVKKGHPWG